MKIKTSLLKNLSPMRILKALNFKVKGMNVSQDSL